MKFIFNLAKKLLPKISETEMIALRSGNVSLDRKIMENSVKKSFFTNLSNNCHQNIVDQQISKITKNIDSTPVFQNGVLNSNLKDNIKSSKAFSYIIDQKYGGLNLNVTTQSKILTKLTSFNPSLGVSVMVPNSLGPAELLQHYGNNEQKNKYLPDLVSGDLIPCFGLTGPNNGSDAAGDIDKGIVIEKEGKKYIKANINKRYITLAPIANLIGLAFNLEDPNNLLEKGKTGITLALLEKNKTQLRQNTYHNPLNVGFPNGTLKGDILFEIENVIGGEKNCGEGWKMLMECLAAGRGVSLPASALGSSIAVTYGVTGYSNLRRQFNIPLSKMQGIQEKLANMVYQTLLIDSSVKLTNAILDSGVKPSVISAIMKQQTTERARIVLNEGMDIYAGSAICVGKNNFMEKFYNSGPIGITVEGSNTLTRSLIIFGQGLNKSHPYIGDIVQNIQENNKKEFNSNIKKMISFTLTSYFDSLSNNFKSKNNLEKKISLLNTSFSHLTNVVSILGGKLKKEQILSGYMADFFSNLFMSYSIIYNSEKINLDSEVKKICLKKIINETIDCLEKIYNLVPISLRPLIIGHFNFKKEKISNQEIEYLANSIWKNKDLNQYFEDQIILDTDNLYNIKSSNEKYDENEYQNIISVGEYKIN